MKTALPAYVANITLKYSLRQIVLFSRNVFLFQKFHLLRETEIACQIKMTLIIHK